MPDDDQYAIQLWEEPCAFGMIAEEFSRYSWAEIPVDAKARFRTAVAKAGGSPILVRKMNLQP